eukprot:s4936_g3.t1
MQLISRGEYLGLKACHHLSAQATPNGLVSVQDLVDCEVFVCDRTEQAFVDECSGCAVLIGCCSGPTFVRDCKGCTFWVATRQLRTRDCIDCKFFLHSHTEPIIESSKDLAFAPFAASYPGVAEHFQEAKMDAGPHPFLAVIRIGGLCREVVLEYFGVVSLCKQPATADDKLLRCVRIKFQVFS